MSLKSLSLNFEQLENKIALSTLSHAVYHGNNNPVVKHPVYHRTKINPIHVPTVPSPINSTPPTILSPINSTPPQVPKQIVPLKFVQNIMPDGNIRCQPVNNSPTVLNQTEQTRATNITMDKIPEIFFVMHMGKDGVTYCERMEIPSLK